METLEKPPVTIHDLEVLSQSIREQFEALGCAIDAKLCRKEALEQSIADGQETPDDEEPPLTDGQARTLLRMLQEKIETHGLESDPAFTDEDKWEEAIANRKKSDQNGQAGSTNPDTRLTPQMFKDRIRSLANQCEKEREMLKGMEIELSIEKLKLAELKVKVANLLKLIRQQNKKKRQQAKTRSKPTASDRWYKARKLRG